MPQIHFDFFFFIILFLFFFSDQEILALNRDFPILICNSSVSYYGLQVKYSHKHGWAVSFDSESVSESLIVKWFSRR